MKSQSAHHNPATSAERIETAEAVLTTMRQFGFNWSFSKALRAVSACRGRMDVERWIALRVEHKLDQPTRQRLRETLRAALWYNDLTGIDAVLNADGHTDPRLAQGGNGTRETQRKGNSRNGNSSNNIQRDRNHRHTDRRSRSRTQHD